MIFAHVCAHVLNICVQVGVVKVCVCVMQVCVQEGVIRPPPHTHFGHTHLQTYMQNTYTIQPTCTYLGATPTSDNTLLGISILIENVVFYK